MRTRILKLGMEVEGEYSEEFSRIAQILGSLGGDSSVSACPPCAERLNLHTAEFKSNPTPIAKMKSLHDILGVFQEAWDTKQYHNNTSAGFHIHCSFKPKIPCELWSLQFQKYFLKELQEKFPDVIPLRGKNHYCKVVNSEEQIAFSNERYKAINFLGAMKKHGTIEFRIFPATEPRIMQEYLAFTIKTIKTFLKSSNEKGLRRKFVVEFDDTPKTLDIEDVIKKEQQGRGRDRYGLYTTFPQIRPGMRTQARPDTILYPIPENV